MNTELMSDITLTLPFIVLAIGALAALMLGAFSGARSYGLVQAAVCLLFLGTAYTIWRDGPAMQTARVFHDMLVISGFTQIMGTVILTLSALAVLLAGVVPKTSPLYRFEVPVLMALSTLGMLILVSANDLLVVYMGLELMSLPLYVLAALNRNAVLSSEAGLKYFILGALASGFFLFGASFLYGVTGSTQFDVISAALSAQSGQTIQIILVLSIAFILAAIAFKISAVPFHMWTPDVYQGAPLAVVSFFAGAPKLTAMALLIGLLYGPLSSASIQWHQIILLLSVGSMLVGAFAALRQTSVKRILAYSSIANMGYALVGVLAAGSAGLASAVLFLIIYGFVTAGVFGLLLLLERKGHDIDNLDDLRGLSTRAPVVSYGLALMMFTLSGLPPMAGFFGKLAVFQAAIAADLIWVAVLGVTASVVAAYYYLNIIRAMFFESPTHQETNMRIQFGSVAVATVCLAFVLLYPFFAQTVAQLADAAAMSFGR